AAPPAASFIIRSATTRFDSIASMKAANDGNMNEGLARGLAHRIGADTNAGPRRKLRPQSGEVEAILGWPAGGAIARATKDSFSARLVPRHPVPRDTTGDLAALDWRQMRVNAARRPEDDAGVVPHRIHYILRRELAFAGIKPPQPRLVAQALWRRDRRRCV